MAATVLVANAKSQLSDTSSISATSGNVKITSSLTSNITTMADSSAAGSGAGIAVGVVVTDSEAFIDSTNATPVNAKSLTVSADTDDNTPTTGKSSPNGIEGERHQLQQPTNNPANGGSAQSDAAGGKADGQSKTSDGNQNLSAALSVTVLVATTQAYIAPSSGSTVDRRRHRHDPRARRLVGQLVGDRRRRQRQVLARRADARAPPRRLARRLDDLLLHRDRDVRGREHDRERRPDAERDRRHAHRRVDGRLRHERQAHRRGPHRHLRVHGHRPAATQFTGVSGCTGSPAGGEAVTEVRESMPSPEAKLEIASGATNKTIGLNWTRRRERDRLQGLPRRPRAARAVPRRGRRHELQRRRQRDAERHRQAPTDRPELRHRHRRRRQRRRPHHEGLSSTATSASWRTPSRSRPSRPGAARRRSTAPLQSLAGGTLVVASTTGFASAGTFQVAGITGACSYASTGRDALLRDHRLHRHSERHGDRHRRQLDLHGARDVGSRREQRRRRGLDRRQRRHLQHDVERRGRRTRSR